MSNKQTNNSGYIIVEILIAIVVFAVVGLSLFSTLSFTLLRTEKSRYEAQAALLVQEGIEATYSMSLSGWTGGNGAYQLAELQLPNGRRAWDLIPGEESGIQTRFQRKITVSAACRRANTGELVTCPDGMVDPKSRIIQTQVLWNESGVEKKLEAQLLVLQHE